MHAVLGATNALNEPLVGLVGGPHYYARFGFRLGEEYDTAFRFLATRQVRLRAAIQSSMSAAMAGPGLRPRASASGWISSANEPPRALMPM